MKLEIITNPVTHTSNSKFIVPVVWIKSKHPGCFKHNMLKGFISKNTYLSFLTVIKLVCYLFLTPPTNKDLLFMSDKEVASVKFFNNSIFVKKISLKISSDNEFW